MQKDFIKPGPYNLTFWRRCRVSNCLSSNISYICISTLCAELQYFSYRCQILKINKKITRIIVIFWHFTYFAGCYYAQFVYR